MSASIPRYETQQIDEEYVSESVAWGDFNSDGVIDLIVGPYWYEGPDFKHRRTVFPQPDLDPARGYAPSTQPCFVHDFNDDGWPDILCVLREPGSKGNYGFHGWEGEDGWRAMWFENPAGRDREWTPHRVLGNIANEAITWVDINQDGRPELIYSSREATGFATFDPADACRPWVFHPVSDPDKRALKHGVGVGDITGNGRLDLLSPEGWWKHPEGNAAAGPWIWHPVRFAERAAEMFVYDIDGDGLNDVITVWDAHRYGLVWHRQMRSASGDVSWERHDISPTDLQLPVHTSVAPAPPRSAAAGSVLSGAEHVNVPGARAASAPLTEMPQLPSPNDASAFGRTADATPVGSVPCISQLHALTLADLDGDGVPELVTGKRFWAHGPGGDVDADRPAVLCAIRLERGADGAVSFRSDIIHAESGVGNQIAVQDPAQGTLPMLATSNKKGVFIHRPFCAFR